MYHKGQIILENTEILKKEFLSEVAEKEKLSVIILKILNMGQTPVYLDMISDTTIDFIGAENISIERINWRMIKKILIPYSNWFKEKVLLIIDRAQSHVLDISLKLFKNLDVNYVLISPGLTHIWTI